MKTKTAFFLILTLSFVSCINDAKNHTLKTEPVVSQDKLKNYVNDFNEKDYEIYKQFYANSEAYEFLRKNIPLIDLPSKEIEETYYFRWWTYRKHIKNTDD